MLMTITVRTMKLMKIMAVPEIMGAMLEVEDELMNSTPKAMMQRHTMMPSILLIIVGLRFVG